jgi:hypothetical protein
MKIQELRIGNLVKCKTSNDSAIYSVIQIDGFGLKVRLSHPRHAEFTPIDRIKPITLTEEILLKCGFERRGAYLGIAHVDTVYWYSPENQILYIEYTDSPFPEDEGVRYPISSPIKHLHTLMNAIYDLTGEELEVKL